MVIWLAERSDEYPAVLHIADSETGLILDNLYIKDLKNYNNRSALGIAAS